MPCREAVSSSPEEVRDGLAAGDFVDLMRIVHALEDLVKVHLDLADEFLPLGAKDGVDVEALADRVFARELVLRVPRIIAHCW